MQVGDTPDISFLHTNFFVKNLLATLSLSSESDARNIACQNCVSADTAETRCVQCNRYLCQFCTDAHKRFQDTKDHILKTISELKASAPSTFAETVRCTKHKDEVVKLYCTTCQATICRDCAIVDHRQHNFSFVEDVAKEEREELQNLVEEVKKRKKEVSEGLQKVKERQQSLSKRNESTIAEINKYFENEIKTLDVKRNELIKKSKTLDDEKQKQLFAQREGLETTLGSCESNIEFTEQALENGNDVQVLNMKKYISQSLETLKRTKSQFQPCVDDYLEFVTTLPKEDLKKRLDESLSVVDAKKQSENYSANFKKSEKWLKVGKKIEITIKCNSNAKHSGNPPTRREAIKPIFTGVPVKGVTVIEITTGSYNVSFVPLEVGVLKFELLMNGRPAPQCTLSKCVRWALTKKRRPSLPLFYVGDCVLESGIHTWKIKVDHSECSSVQKARSMFGVIHYDTVNSEVQEKNRCGLSGFISTGSTLNIMCQLDMSKKLLTVTPSWGSQTTSSYSVSYSTVSPVYSSDCSECKISVNEMGPFSFEDFYC